MPSTERTERLASIGALYIDRERKRRALLGFESSGSYLSARDARRELSKADAALDAAVAAAVADEVVSQ